MSVGNLFNNLMAYACAECTQNYDCNGQRLPC
jgi:hypothetical protein